MQPTMSFNLVGGPGVRVTVVQTADGKLQITASVISGAIVGDLRGLFFHVTDESLLSGLQVGEGTSPLGAFQTGANAVSNLGAGVSMAGAAQPYDAGVAFGTASAAGADDIRSVTFTLSHSSQALTLDSLASMSFGAVMTSVGIQGGARFGTIKATGSAPANLAPDAVGDSATVDENGSVAIAVLANDTDPHQDALSISGFTQPAAGSVSQSGNQLVFDTTGAFDWLASGEGADVTFSYTISDGRGGSDTTTVTVRVTGTNDGPSAQDQQALVYEDGATDEVGGSLLAGATDPDASDTLSVVAVNGAAATTVEGTYGSLVWNADGSFTYTLNNALETVNSLAASQEVSEAFTFTVSDGQGGSDTRTLMVIVVGANDAPTVADDAQTVAEDDVLNGSVAGLAADAEGDGLGFALVGAAPVGLVFNADGTYTYTPPADFDGDVSFQFVANDGTVDSNTGTVTIDVLPVNDAPTDIALTNNAVAENSAVGTLIGLLSATDVDGGPASFSIVGGPSPFQVNGNRLEVAGALDYETQNSYSVTIRADDGAGGTYDEVFTVTVTDVDEGGGNTAPTVTNDSRTVDEDGVLSGSVIGLANDADSDPLTFALVGGAPAGLVFNGDGSYTYTPPADFDGDISFQFIANDGTVDSNTGTVTIDVLPVNDAPTVVNDSRTVDEDGVLNGSVAGLANDVDGDGLTFALVGSAPAGLVFNADGTYTYTPPADFDGDATFQFIANDGTADSNTGTVTIDVLPVNDAPTVVNDSRTVDEDGVFNGSVAGLANDVDGDGLTFALVGAAPAGLVFNADGTYTYTPPAHFDGDVSFEFVANDGTADSNTGTVTIDVLPVNDAPTVVNDSRTVDEDGVLNGSVAGLANDVDGDGLTFALVGSAPAGLVFNADGTYTYTPPAHFDGDISFQFVANDGTADSNTGTVTIDVLPVNDAPTDIALTNNAVAENSAVGTLIGLLSATDVDGGPASFSIVGGPSPFQVNGNRLEVAGALDYETQNSYSVTIRADDGAGGTYDEVFTVTVTDVDEGGGNTAPTVTNDSRTVDEDGVLSGSVIGLANDADADPLTFALVGLAPAGLVFNGDGSYTYTPPADFDGDISFQFVANDGTSNSNTGTVTIDVLPVNDAPTTPNGVSATINEDTSVFFTLAELLAGATDVDGGALSVTALDNNGQIFASFDTGGIHVSSFAVNQTGLAVGYYTVSDGNGGTSTGTISLTILPVNDAPTVRSETFAGVEDTARVFSVAALLADLAEDVDGDPLSLVSVTSASGGTVDITGDVLTFTPDADFNGTGWFFLTVTDGLLTGGNWQYIAFADVNDAPIAEDDQVTRNGTDPQVIGRGDLFFNDSDIDSPQAGWSIALGTATGGTVSLDANGNVVFDFDPLHTGAYSFTYQVDDGEGGLSNLATVTLNTPPDAVDDEATATENDAYQAWQAVSVLGNDTDDDGDSLVVTGASLVGATAPIVVTWDAGSVYFYSTDSAWSGDFAISYSISDGRGGTDTAFVQVTVTPSDDAPNATPDFMDGTPIGTTDELTPIIIPFSALLANDFHEDGTSFTITSVESFHRGTAALVDTDADTIADAVLFTPQVQNNNFYDYSNSWLGYFYYTVTDADGDTDQTYAYVRVNDVNQAPDAVGETLARQPSPQVIAFDTLFANDLDYDSPEEGWTISAISNEAGVAVVVDNTARTLTVTYDGGYSGTYGFDYTLDDGEGGTDTASVILDTAPQQTGPVGTLVLDEDAWQYVPDATLIALAGVTDADGDPLFIINPVAGANLYASDWFDSVYVVNDPADWNGASELTFTVSDGHPGGQITVTIPVTINPVNDAPRDPEGDDAALGLATAEDTALLITIADLLADDANPADEVQSVSLYDVSPWGFGSIVDNNNGTLTFTPNANFNGTAGFYYRTQDEQGAVSNYVWVPITVTPVEDPVDAVDDFVGRAITGPGEQRIAIATLLANDSDDDGDGTIVSVTAGSNVTGVFIDGTDVVVQYGPGVATFTYTLSDGTTSDTATVTLSGVPYDTTAAIGYEAIGYPTDGVFQGTEDTDLVILKADLMADDVDPDGGTLTWYAAYNYYTLGYIVAQDETSVTFRPYADYNGESIGFYYYVTDDEGELSAPIYVYVNLAATPDPIVASDDYLNRDTGATQVIAAAEMLGNDVDPDIGDTKDIVSVTAVNGLDAIVLNADDSVTVTYDPTYVGRASYTYTVEDGQGNTDTATVFLNRLPVAGDDGPFTLDEGENSVFIPFSALLANDSDADGDSLTLYFYSSSQVYAQYAFEGGEAGWRIVLYDGSYTGSAEFTYYVYDGTGTSNYATVTLDVVAGNDAPVAQDDYWQNNGAQFGDRNPATNPMAGTEDTVLEFAVSLLIDGQSVSGYPYVYGTDTDEEGTPLSIVAGSLLSPFGTVELVNIAGVDSIRFTPNADVNSAYPWGGTGDYGIYFTYRVTDGDRESNTATAYLYLNPSDDTPDAVDDSFDVIGNGPWTLDIGNYYGGFGVFANDSSPDDYPYALDYGYTTITGVEAVSGIADLFWDGYNITVVADGSGDPIVFSYTITDYDGDSDTAFVTLNALGQAPQRFYFSGEVVSQGRELWVYDPASYSEDLGSAYATMVDEAETWSGPDGGNPREITALGGTVFWRATQLVDEEGSSYLADRWHAYNPGLGYIETGRDVAYYAFDGALDLDEQNLGVRAGDLFWGAGYYEGESLIAWNEIGIEVAQVYLPGYDRELLTDAGGQPAYAALDYTEVWNPETETYESFDAEQLFAVLHNSWGWETVRITDGGTADNDIREIAAGSVQDDPYGSGQSVKHVYFAGDFANDWQGAHANGLWRVSVTTYGSGWGSYQQPELISDELVASNPHDLTIAVVSDGEGGTWERLFWFQLDSAGEGQIATRREDYFNGFSTSTGSSFLGESFTGREIRQWQDGVVFSGTASGGDFVALYTDNDAGVGEAYFISTVVMMNILGEVEQLVVDGLGNVAWIVDDGTFDTVWTYDGSAVSFITSRFGEITDLQAAGGTIVFVAQSDVGFYDTLFSYDIATASLLEVPTDEPTDAGPANGFFTGNGNLAIAGGLAFDGDDGSGSRIWFADALNGTVTDTGGFRYSSVVSYNGDWVGAGAFDVGAGYQAGLYRVTSGGTVQQLFNADATFVRGEVELLGDQVLFGDNAAGTPTIWTYDLVAGTASPLLTGYALGTAERIGSSIIFSAFEAASNTWDLYEWDGTTANFVDDLPGTSATFTPTGEWRGELDFLGNEDFLYFKYQWAGLGEEVVVYDRNLGVANPLDIRPGPESGASWGDAVFVDGRIYFQASADGTAASMRLYTTTDGNDLEIVAGPDLLDGYQFPWLPEVIGGTAYVLAASTPSASNTWGIFELSGATATLISPTDFGFISGLEAIGGALYFSEFEGAGEQVWRMTPGEAPELLTSFANGGSNSDFFEGGDGLIYFARDDGDYGRELWVLDSAEAVGARLIADINPGFEAGGYAPEQVAAVPDALDHLRMLEAWYAGGGIGVGT